MELKDYIVNIRASIKAGQFVNEASVSQGIVMPLLHALGWPVFNPQIVAPEFTVEGRRVDYALCHPQSKPYVFVEVKQIGQSDGADKQLFEYAFHYGVPMAILTDGQEWHFYLPAEQGLYQERRVYKLDIVERDLDECHRCLTRYLAYEAICSGHAVEAARQDYQNVTRERQIKAALPTAWQKLIEEQDEILIELLADRVASLCGYKPEPNVVAQFLVHNIDIKQTIVSKPLSKPPAIAHPVIKPAVISSFRSMVKPTKSEPPPVKQVAPSIRKTVVQKPAMVGFILLGHQFHANSGRDALTKIFNELSNIDPTFLSRFAALPNHGKIRRYLAQRPEDLYPDRPDLAYNHSVQIKPGWWMSTNHNMPTMEKIAAMACDIVGLRYGDDLIINR